MIMEETNRITGIIFEHGKDDLELWEGFKLSEEDENTIWNILSKYDAEGCSVRGSRKGIAEEIDEMKNRIFKTVKITAGMTQEFEIISTDAPDYVIKAQLAYNNACEEEGKTIENPYYVIEELGYKANCLGCQDDFDSEDMETAIIDAEFDYYDI